MLGARNRACNGNVWYFALLQQLIFWLNCDKAEICTLNFTIFPLDENPTPGAGDPLPHPTASTAISGKRPLVLGENCYAAGRPMFKTI